MIKKQRVDCIQQKDSHSIASYCLVINQQRVDCIQQKDSNSLPAIVWILTDRGLTVSSKRTATACQPLFGYRQRVSCIQQKDSHSIARQFLDIQRFNKSKGTTTDNHLYESGPIRATSQPQQQQTLGNRVRSFNNRNSMANHGRALNLDNNSQSTTPAFACQCSGQRLYRRQQQQSRNLIFAIYSRNK